MQEWQKTAEQFNPQTVWLRVCQTITTAVTGFAWLSNLCALKRQGMAMIEFKGSHFEREVILWVYAGTWHIQSVIAIWKK
ncbi:hypothetical protein ACFOFO_02355 [Undibacterium arcticum]|uniref:Uncharacterized protein n=1 Tax=Undibacterium arcticum TaxID=1762892 RepID=A0ABV7EZ09_9BURK